MLYEVITGRGNDREWICGTDCERIADGICGGIKSTYWFTDGRVGRVKIESRNKIQDS